MPTNNLRTLFVLLFIAVAVLGGHLLPGLDNSRVEDGVRNGLHVAVFAVVALIVFEVLIRSGKSALVATLATAILVATIGVSAEVLQFLSGSQADMSDVLRDFSGAGLALVGRTVWRWTNRAGKPAAARLVGRATSVVASMLVFAPLAFWLSIIALGRASSPVILDFSQWWNEYTYRPINAELVSQGEDTGYVNIELLKRGRSGLVISPLLRDWSKHDFLSITAGMSVGPDTNVTIRINDGDRLNNWSDQFLASIVIDANVSTFRIPLGDLIDEPGHPAVDLSDIQEVVIFARDRRRNTVMHIEELRLE